MTPPSPTLHAELTPGGQTRGRRHAAQFFVVAGFVLLSPVISVTLRTTERVPSQHSQGASKSALVKELRSANPDYVILGDSMAFTRLEKPDIDQASGRKFYLLTAPGSASAVWYLWLKNIIIPSGVKPRAVIVFFRDSQLTMPGYRTEGLYLPYIESLREFDEPVLDSLIRSDAGGAFSLVYHTERLLTGPEGLFAFHRSRPKARRALDVLCFGLTRLITGCPEKTQKKLLNTRFAMDSLRKDVAGEMAETGADEETGKAQAFSTEPGDSFLPHITALARAHELELCFYRVKRRPQKGDHRSDGRAMAAYIGSLKHWIEAQGARLYDETPDDSIPFSMYADGDHIAAAQRRRYAGIFWRRLGPLLP